MSGLASAPAAAPGTDRRAVLVTVLAGAAGAMALGKVPPLLPSLRAELGLDLVATSWIASAFNVLAMTLGVYIGLMLRRLPARTVVVGGLALAVAAALAGATTERLEALLAARLVEGVGFLAASIAVPVRLAQVTAPADRPAIFGLWAVHLPLGAGLGMCAAPVLAAAFGWRAAWVLALLPAALAALALPRWGGAVVAGEGETASASWIASLRRVGRSGVVWGLVGAFVVYALELWAVFVWLPTVLVERGGLGAGALAAIAAVVVLANVPGNLLGAALVRRGVPRDRLIAAAAVGMSVAGWLVFTPGLPIGGVIAAAVTLSAVGGLLPPAVMSATPSLGRDGTEIAVLQGGFVQAAAIGQFLGPPLMALVVARGGGWEAGRWLFLLGLLVALLFASSGARRRADR